MHHIHDQQKPKAKPYKGSRQQLQLLAATINKNHEKHTQLNAKLFQQTGTYDPPP